MHPKILILWSTFLQFFCLPIDFFSFLSLICPLNLCQSTSSFCYCSLKLEVACNSSLVLLMKLKQRDGSNNSLTKYLFTPGIFCSLILLQTVLQELHTLISHSTVSPWIDYYCLTHNQHWWVCNLQKDSFAKVCTVGANFVSRFGFKRFLWLVSVYKLIVCSKLKQNVFKCLFRSRNCSIVWTFRGLVLKWFGTFLNPRLEHQPFPLPHQATQTHSLQITSFAFFFLLPTNLVAATCSYHHVPVFF